MSGARAFLIFLVAAGCGSVRDVPGDGPSGTDGTGPGTDSGGTTCGQRGQACCANSVCDTRASCVENVCIAADVWASSPDGTFDFNGGAWIHPLLTGSTAQLPAVNGLWGTTSTFVVGVGQAGLILRLDASGWHRDAAARGDGTGTLFGVGGSGATDVWAVGDAHFAHYTGNGWLDVTPPATSEAFRAVWLSGPGEGWACGDAGLLAHLSGGTWTAAGRLGGSYGRNGLWGSGPSDIWMVGFKHSLATGLPLSIEHYNGQAWSDGAGGLDPQGSLPPLEAVWGSDASHVWAVGDGGTIVFWNGQLWKSILSGTTDDLLSVWGSGPSDVWVAGKGGVRHFNGMSWSAMAGVTAPLALWLSKQ